jgi:hypothetical protein
MNEKREITKETLYTEERKRKSIENCERSDKTAEKHGQTERQQRKVRKQSQVQSPAS